MESQAQTQQPKSAEIIITDQPTQPLPEQQSIKPSVRVGQIYRDHHYKIGLGSN